MGWRGLRLQCVAVAGQEPGLVSHIAGILGSPLELRLVR